MTFATLKTKLETYLVRGDLTAVSGDFINMGIMDLERERNYDHMKVRYESALVEDDYLLTNPIPLYKEAIDLHIIDSNGYRYPPLERRSQEYMTARYRDYTDSKGRPLYYCRIPVVETTLTPDALPTHKFMLRPTCDASYTLEINAYQYSPEMEGVTYLSNWWTVNAWDIALYAGLLEAEPYLDNDTRIATWKKLRDNKAKMLWTAQQRESISGSHQNIKPANSRAVSDEVFNIDTID